MCFLSCARRDCIFVKLVARKFCCQRVPCSEATCSIFASRDAARDFVSRCIRIPIGGLAFRIAFFADEGDKKLSRLLADREMNMRPLIVRKHILSNNMRKDIVRNTSLTKTDICGTRKDVVA